MEDAPRQLRLPFAFLSPERRWPPTCVLGLRCLLESHPAPSSPSPSPFPTPERAPTFPGRSGGVDAGAGTAEAAASIRAAASRACLRRGEGEPRALAGWNPGQRGRERRAQASGERPQRAKRHRRPPRAGRPVLVLPRFSGDRMGRWCLAGRPGREPEPPPGRARAPACGAGARRPARAQRGAASRRDLPEAAQRSGANAEGRRRAGRKRREGERSVRPL